MKIQSRKPKELPDEPLSPEEIHSMIQDICTFETMTDAKRLTTGALGLLLRMNKIYDYAVRLSGTATKLEAAFVMKQDGKVHRFEIV